MLILVINIIYSGVRRMDTRDWELLLALEEEKSMNRAGEKLFLSQPAVVYRLNRMEQEFGTTLFIRSNRGVQFTGAGRRLYSHAGEMLQKTSSIRQEIAQYGQGLSGSIVVGSSATFLGAFLPLQLKDFYRRYPNISVSLVTDRNDVLVDMLSSGRLPLAVVRIQSQWEGAIHHIYDDPLVVISSRPCPVEELAGIPYIPYGGDSQLTGAITEWRQRTLRGPFVTGTHTAQVNGPQICMELVKAGLGWSVVPLTRTLNVDGLYHYPVLDAAGKNVLRTTSLLYGRELENVEIYAAYLHHFLEFFSDFPFPAVSSECKWSSSSP